MENNNQAMEDTVEFSGELMTSLGQSIRSNLGEYVIVSQLKRGGEGFVFKIKEIKKKNQYALKAIYMNPKLDSKSRSKLQSKIQNQVTIHKQLSYCSSFVTFRTFFRDIQNSYIVMEFCDEGDLTQFIKNNGPLTTQQVRTFGRNICEGIEYMHNSRIVHRDIKPNNILITKGNIAKIGDFGLAAKGQIFTNAVGTLNYMSPEIVSLKKYQKEIDMWSFGCTLYYMATGTQLFNFTKMNDSLQYFLHSTIELEFPEVFNKDLKDLICNLVVKDPKLRLTASGALKSNFFNPRKVSTPSPFKTIRSLKNTSFQVSQGTITIDQNGFRFQKQKPLKGQVKKLSSKVFSFFINGQGSVIRIKSQKGCKQFNLQSLPTKYHQIYQYCKSVGQILEQNSAISSLQNKNGRFQMLKNGKFVAKFRNGSKYQFRKLQQIKDGNSEEMKLVKTYFEAMKYLC